MRRLAERSNNVNHQLDARTGINVVLVGSTGGGQGSGTVWDLTYLTREKLAELGDLGDASRVLETVRGFGYRFRGDALDRGSDATERSHARAHSVRG